MDKGKDNLGRFIKGHSFGNRFKKGEPSLNKGRHYKCKSYNLSEEGKLQKIKNLGNGMLGKKQSDYQKQKMSELNKGKIMSDNQKRKISKTNKKKGLCPPKKFWFQNGHKSANYIDGRTNICKRIRLMKEYLQWRANVFKRDNYHCQCCGEKGYIEAHHIIPFSKIVSEFNLKNQNDARKCKELWNIGNGITYCRKCHIELDENIGKNIGLINARYTNG